LTQFIAAMRLLSVIHSIRRLAGAALVAAALSCAEPLVSDVLPPGTYRLILVEGAALPFRGTTALTVRGSLSLSSGHSYTLLQTDSAIAGGALTEFRSQGTWSLSENAIVLHDGGSVNIYLGVVAPVDSVRVNLNGRVNTYIRQ
jgi:hypothetical protein